MKNYKVYHMRHYIDKARCVGRFNNKEEAIDFATVSASITDKKCGLWAVFFKDQMVMVVKAHQEPYIEKTWREL